MAGRTGARAEKPNLSTSSKTIEFYEQQTRYLLAFQFLANRRLDEIDEAAVEQFAQARRPQVGPATTNRGLAVLRSMLRLAREWRSWIGDRSHGFACCEGNGIVSSSSVEIRRGSTWSFCPPVLHQVDMLMLDTGLGPAEAGPWNGGTYSLIICRSAKGKPVTASVV